MAKEFYRHANAYDIAFKDRDFDIECDFLVWCLHRYGKMKTKKLAKKSFLELACGPGRHAREFAKRGWKADALDLSAEMAEFVASESAKEGLKVKTMVADMSKFKSKSKYVLAATLMESISHLTTNEQMISHFKSVAKCLVPGGIYVIEATHPMFYFPDEEINSWMYEEGNIKVEITFGLPTDEFDSVKQVWNLTTRMKIKEGDLPEQLIETVGPVRWYLAQEMKALIDLSGAFDKYWFYGSMSYLPPQKLDDSEDSDAMVIVMRKK